MGGTRYGCRAVCILRNPITHGALPVIARTGMIILGRSNTFMRKFSFAALSVAAVAGALALSACSEKTQDNAADTASSAADDVATTAADVGAAASTTAADLGDAANKALDDAGTAADKAADRASAAADKMGARVKQGAAEAEATMQDEPVSKAKVD